MGFDEVNRRVSLDGECVNPFDSSKSFSEGEWKVAFRTPTVPADSFCHAEKRICSGGNTMGSFRYESCSNEVTTGFCGSPFPAGNPIAEGSSTTAHYIDANGNCQTSTRTCSGAVLSGQGNLPACPNDNKCTLPWGLQLAEGGYIITKNREGAPKVPGTCGLPLIKWTCVSGQISELTLPDSCSPGACTAPWGELVGNGMSVTAYKTEITTNCNSMKTTRTCTNGVLSGNAAYNRPHCFEDRNPCRLPWGENLQSGGSVYAYPAPVAYGGSVCDRQVLSCVNGTLTGPFGTHVSKTCTVSQRTCGAPWDPTQIYQHLQTTQGCRATTGTAANPCNCTTIQCVDGTFSNSAWNQKSCQQTD